MSLNAPPAKLDDLQTLHTLVVALEQAVESSSWSGDGTFCFVRSYLMGFSSYFGRMIFAISLAAMVGLVGCRNQKSGFEMVRADQLVSSGSKYPLAVDPQRVGTYEADSKSGAGYFYDDVLEYRVWLHPERGATPLNGDKDYYAAFAQYERAQAFSKNTMGSEEPLVLVRQREWINEPRPGEYHPEQGERITEWQVKWLAESKRTATSIRDFMAHPTPAPVNE